MPLQREPLDPALPAGGDPQEAGGSAQSPPLFDGAHLLQLLSGTLRAAVDPAMPVGDWEPEAGK